jgi:hypothetical protein
MKRWSFPSWKPQTLALAATAALCAIVWAAGAHSTRAAVRGGPRADRVRSFGQSTSAPAPAASDDPLANAPQTDSDPADLALIAAAAGFLIDANGVDPDADGAFLFCNSAGPCSYGQEQCVISDGQGNDTLGACSNQCTCVACPH